MKISNINSGIVKFVAGGLPTGGFYTRSGGAVVWVSTGPLRSRNGATYAQWYIDHDFGTVASTDEHSGGPWFADTGGFRRKDYGSYNCDGNCSHIGCGDNTYLTAERAQADYVHNMNEYLAAINICAAGATCTTKTATFKISATYTDGNKVKHTVEYPLSLNGNAKDELTSRDDNSERGENKKALNGTILSYNGCYGRGSAKDWYQSEWTFPGTWVNNKTGEISFKSQPSNTWHEAKNKFCLLLDAQDVNEQWWNYYMRNKRASLNQNASGSYTSQEYDSTCPNIKNQNQLPTSIDWNINAETDEFGYHGWKFNIACFYAINSHGTQDLENEDKCDTSPDNFETRTVDTLDLFPSADDSGEQTNTSTNKTKVGRTQGFNWTQSASITPDKNDIYAVNPEVLIGKIQNAGRTIYDEDKESTYLDYEFNLTSRDLNNIKKDNRRIGDYTNWQGKSTYDEKTKLYIYSSSLFRNGGIISDSTKAVKLGKLGCNNQASASKCDFSIR